jgi:hypothetical protein
VPLHLDAATKVMAQGLFLARTRAVERRREPGTRYRRLAGEALEVRALLTANFGFVKTMGALSPTFTQGATSVVDSSGNVYLGGTFQGSVDIDPGSGTTNLTAVGSHDGFVAKYSVAGELIWAHRFGGAGVDRAAKLAIDPSGNLWVAGEYSGTTDFDPGAGVASKTVTGNLGEFIWKLSPSGAHLWVGAIDQSLTSTNGEEAINGLEVDGSGNVLVAGWFAGTADLDPGTGTHNVTSVLRSGTSTYDAFVLKLDNSGNFLWGKAFGGNVINAFGDVASDVGVDAAGNVYVTGSFAGTVDFDPGPGVTSFTTAGLDLNYDNFVSKFDASGNFLWARARGGPAADGAHAMAVDAAGNVFTAGGFQGPVDFDPGTGTATRTAPPGPPDAFVTKLNTNGSFQWVSQFGGAGLAPEFVSDLVLDDSGEIFAVGQFGTNADFDPGTGTQTVNPAGRQHGRWIRAAAERRWRFDRGPCGRRSRQPRDALHHIKA